MDTSLSSSSLTGTREHHTVYEAYKKTVHDHQWNGEENTKRVPVQSNSEIELAYKLKANTRNHVLRIEVSGKRGVDGIDDKDGADATDRSAAGAGGDGQPGGKGEDGSFLDILLESAEQSRELLKRKVRVNYSGRFVELLLGLGDVIFVDASGGDGGAGGNGGFGGSGLTGTSQAVNITTNSNLLLGAEGGKGGKGGAGGAGGNVTIRAFDPLLFQFVEVRVNAGIRGPDGAPGKSGVNHPSKQQQQQQSALEIWKPLQSASSAETLHGSVQYLLLDPRDGRTLRSGNQMYDVVLEQCTLVNQHGRSNDVFVPGTEIQVSSVVLWNPGALDVPSGSIIRILRTDDITIEPLEDSVGLPVIPAGQRLRLATNVRAKVLRAKGPRTVTIVIEIVSSDGRPFPCGYRAYDVEFNWQFLITHCLYPREISRGETQKVSVTVLNCSEELQPMNAIQIRWCSAASALQCVGGTSSSVVQSPLLRPHESFTQIFELQLIDDSMLFESVLWRVQLLQQYEEIESLEQFCRVSSLYDHSRPPGDLLLVLGSKEGNFTRVEYLWWQRLLSSVGLTFNVWDAACNDPHGDPSRDPDSDSDANQRPSYFYRKCLSRYRNRPAIFVAKERDDLEGFDWGDFVEHFSPGYCSGNDSQPVDNDSGLAVLGVGGSELEMKFRQVAKQIHLFAEEFSIPIAWTGLIAPHVPSQVEIDQKANQICEDLATKDALHMYKRKQMDVKVERREGRWSLGFLEIARLPLPRVARCVSFSDKEPPTNLSISPADLDAFSAQPFPRFRISSRVTQTLLAIFSALSIAKKVSLLADQNLPAVQWKFQRNNVDENANNNSELSFAELLNASLYDDLKSEFFVRAQQRESNVLANTLSPRLESLLHVLQQLFPNNSGGGHRMTFLPALTGAGALIPRIPSPTRTLPEQSSSGSKRSAVESNQSINNVVHRPTSPSSRVQISTLPVTVISNNSAISTARTSSGGSTVTAQSSPRSAVGGHRSPRPSIAPPPSPPQRPTPSHHNSTVTPPTSSIWTPSSTSTILLHNMMTTTTTTESGARDQSPAGSSILSTGSNSASSDIHSGAHRGTVLVTTPRSPRVTTPENSGSPRDRLAAAGGSLFLEFLGESTRVIVPSSASSPSPSPPSTMVHNSSGTSPMGSRISRNSPLSTSASMFNVNAIAAQLAVPAAPPPIGTTPPKDQEEYADEKEKRDRPFNRESLEDDRSFIQKKQTDTPNSAFETPNRVKGTLLARGSSAPPGAMIQQSPMPHNGSASTDSNPGNSFVRSRSWLPTSSSSSASPSSASPASRASPPRSQTVSVNQTHIANTSSRTTTIGSNSSSAAALETIPNHVAITLLSTVIRLQHSTFWHSLIGSKSAQMTRKHLFETEERLQNELIRYGMSKQQVKDLHREAKKLAERNERVRLREICRVQWPLRFDNTPSYF